MTHARLARMLMTVACGTAACAFASPEPPLPITEPHIVGAWMGKTYHGRLTLKLLLRADHRLEWSVDSPEMVNSRPTVGTWRVQEGHLAVLWELRTDTVMLRIHRVTASKLVLSFPEPNTTFHRVRSLITPTSSNQAMQRTPKAFGVAELSLVRPRKSRSLALHFVLNE